jgi:hypothetical protein
MLNLKTECEVYDLLIPRFVALMASCIESYPADKWNWSFNQMTPSARELGEHAFAWLWCDRQQIELPDPADHKPTPTLATQAEVANGLAEEGLRWKQLIERLSDEELSSTRFIWGQETRSVRGFIFHIAQHVIYKFGQLSQLRFAIGLDGSEPYTAPYPNCIYGFEPENSWPAARV